MPDLLRVLVILDPDLALDRVVEGDHRVGGLDEGDFLDGRQEDLHEVVVVEAIDLGEDGIFPRNEVTFDNFRNLLEIGDDLLVLAGLGEGNADEGTDIQAEGLGFHEEAGAGDDPVRLEALHPLVDRRAGHAAFTGDFQERHPRVFHEGGEDLLVDLVEMVLGHMLTV